MYFCGIFVILGTILVNINAIQLPSYFARCSVSSPELGKCITDSGNAALPIFIDGDDSIHVVKLNPLYVESMFIDVNGALKINITKCNIHGLDTAVLKHNHWDLENKHAESEVYIENTSLIGDYDIKGNILFVPINGAGPCNITFERGLFKYAFDFKLETRKDKEYIRITNSSLKYETDRAYFKLYNLFSGNEQLGNTMLQFLDENWRDVNAEIGSRVGDALALVFTNIVQNMFSKIPYNELFAP